MVGGRCQLCSVCFTVDPLPVAVGGVILRRDSRTSQWVQVPSPTTADLFAVLSTLAGKRVWAVGAGGVMIKSDSDGVNVATAQWTVFASPTSRNLRSLAHVDEYVFAVGDHGVVLKHFAAVGATWGWTVSEATANVTVTLRGVSGSNANPFEDWLTFVVIVGDNGTILHSVGGAPFVKMPSPSTANLNSVWIRNPNFGWAVGDSGTVSR